MEVTREAVPRVSAAVCGLALHCDLCEYCFGLLTGLPNKSVCLFVPWTIKVVGQAVNQPKHVEIGKISSRFCGIRVHLTVAFDFDRNCFALSVCRTPLEHTCSFDCLYCCMEVSNPRN